MSNKEKQEVVLLMQLPLYISLTAGVTLLPKITEKLSVFVLEVHGYVLS